MSLSTINQAANDEALLARIEAGVYKETLANDAFGDSAYGGMVKGGGAPIQATFAYPIAVDYEAQYASAVAAENPNPGGDDSVITDANISTSVQVHWPWQVGETPPG